MGHQIDSTLKANATTQVIPSKEAIAEEVLRQQAQRHTEQHGTGVSRETWIDHDNEPDMVKEAGLAYRDTDEGEREVYCPVCLQYRVGDGPVVITVYRRLGITRKSIARHLGTKSHIRALDEKHKE